MGHHFVPQRYLRGFQARAKPDWIWMYDKEKITCKLLPIKEVAQIAGFYTQEVEDELNRKVEIPGGDVIDKIKRGEAIDEMDRRNLTYHIATMIRRVPRNRDKAYGVIPKALTEMAVEMKELFEQEYKEGRISAEVLAKRVAEVEATAQKFIANPPPDVTSVIETPWPFASMLFIIHGMYWRMFKTTGPSFFITSDNPAAFFDDKGMGLGHQDCELVFPLCSDLILHCSRRQCVEEGPQLHTQQLVKEFNRRTAYFAERFLFYHEEAPWVHAIGQNKDPRRIKRINWT
jgi:hypothetical protein